nr:copia protein [Tanacetum cinerariifolium]
MRDEEGESVDNTKYRGMIGTTYLGLWYPKGSDIETIAYADSDHSGDYVDRKSTSGVCTFIGCCLTSWFSKKQTTLAISTIVAEYVSARKACQQALWMKQALVDYDVRLDDIPIMCDNKGAIDLRKNLVQHLRTKHTEICHHFVRDNVQKGNISIEKVSSEDNIADILTKPLKREPFNYLRLGGGASSLTYATSVTKTKAAEYRHIKWIEDLVSNTMWSPVESACDVYCKHRIIAIPKLQIVKWHNYKHLDWITIRKDDGKLYTFKEGDYKRLCLQDIKDILLLLVQGKLINLTIKER